jgi:translation initiation factor IF-2
MKECDLMAKQRIYEIAKQLGLDNKVLVDKAKELGFNIKNHMSSLSDAEVNELKNKVKPSTPAKSKNDEKKENKIKLSVSSIRRPASQAKKHAKHQHSDQAKKRGNDSSNKRRSNRRENDQKQNNKPTKVNKARDLLAELQQKQRAEERTLAKESEKARKIWHEEKNKTSNQNTEKQNSQKKDTNEVTNQPEEKKTKKVLGPKILKPSPARNRPKTEENKQNQNQKSKPKRKPTMNRTPQIPVMPEESVKPDSRRNGNGHGRNTGKPGRKGRDNNNFEHRNEHSDKMERRKRKNKHNNHVEEVRKPKTVRKERPLPEVLVFEEGMNAQDLGKLLHREPAEIVKKLFMLGVMTNQNQSLDKDTIELLAAEYGIESQEKVHEDISDIDNLYQKEVEASKESKHQESRPPVVTIMGHVDHGKTTLLDRLRHTNVSEHEAGGITQKIGAYQVRVDDRLITFLDTPGHAAFSNMRARGAEVTDIVVLVVAADDGVMPQTIEAIDHAKSAGVPIIVAINKMDAPGANPSHVTEQLMKYNLIPEDYGGDTIFVKISAKTGDNVEELLQMILLQADVLELKADPHQKAIGTVVEARLSRGRGPVADILVQQGTLEVGDPIVVGNTFGRVRVMTNDKGRRVKKATPSMPVEITGLNDVPESADKFVVFEDEKTARSVGEQRAQNALQKQREKVQHVTLDNLFDTMKRENMKEVGIVLKADVQGSVEALSQSLEKIDVEGVRVNIIHSGVGAINDSDVTLASASNAFIIGFNVRPTATAKSQAESDEVDIRSYSVIYKAIDDVEAAMKGMLEPTYEEKVTGNLTIRETWKVSKVGTIAGAFVDSGYIHRDSGIRVIRNGVVIYDGQVASLKRFKDDVKEVKQGFDCGLTIENYNDLKIDDELEAYEMQEVKPK